MKPRVVHIVGYGRSGSTVLGMALGQHPDIFNAGELISMPNFVAPTRIPPRACGCLMLVDQCPFWTAVATKAPLLRPAYASVPTMRGWRYYAPWLPSLSPELEEWGAANAALYSAILEKSGARIVIDGSKRADRAWWLWASGSVDLVPLWLTRRLVDVLRSERRRGRWTLRSAASWNARQWRAAQLVRRIEAAGGQVLRGSYEELTADPRAFLGNLLRALDLPWHDGVLHPGPGHVIGGSHQVKHGGVRTIERQIA